MLYKPEEK